MSNGLTEEENDLFDGHIIASYTRQDAIDDGVLVDVSIVAKEAGFKWPVAVTRAVWSDCVEVSPEDSGFQDQEGRLWDILSVLRMAARSANGDSINFKVLVASNKLPGGKKTFDLWSKVTGEGEGGAPVLTIMQQGED